MVRRPGRLRAEPGSGAVVGGRTGPVRPVLATRRPVLLRCRLGRRAPRDGRLRGCEARRASLRPGRRGGSEQPPAPAVRRCGVRYSALPEHRPVRRPVAARSGGGRPHRRGPGTCPRLRRRRSHRPLPGAAGAGAGQRAPRRGAQHRLCSGLDPEGGADEGGRPSRTTALDRVPVHPTRLGAVRVTLPDQDLRQPDSWTVQDLPLRGAALASLARPAHCAGPVRWNDTTKGALLPNLSDGQNPTSPLLRSKL